MPLTAAMHRSERASSRLALDSDQLSAEMLYICTLTMNIKHRSRSLLFQTRAGLGLGPRIYRLSKTREFLVVWAISRIDRPPPFACRQQLSGTTSQKPSLVEKRVW